MKIKKQNVYFIKLNKFVKKHVIINIFITIYVQKDAKEINIQSIISLNNVLIIVIIML